VHKAGEFNLAQSGEKTLSVRLAMTAVENIINGKKSKENNWLVNTEREYHNARK